MTANNQQLAKQRRRDLRARQTDAERLLWAGLRNRRLGRLKFRRQHSVAERSIQLLRNGCARALDH